jgi:hypothetical protein
MFLFVQKTGILVVVPDALSHPMSMIRHSIPEECLEVWDVEPKPKTLDVPHLTFFDKSCGNRTAPTALWNGPATSLPASVSEFHRLIV